MKKNITIHEARPRLCRLLNRVASDEASVITRADEPIARLVPIQVTATRQLGRDAGVFAVPEDFDRPLPDMILWFTRT